MANKARAGRLPGDVVRQLQTPHLAVLATASEDGFPATTLVSWLHALDAERVVMALDRRGLAFTNVVENPYAALEVVVDGFVGTLRGHVVVLREELSRAPFPSAAVLLEIREVRDHAVGGVSISPLTYRFAADRTRYAAIEAEIVGKLRKISEPDGDSFAERDEW